MHVELTFDFTAFRCREGRGEASCFLLASVCLNVCMCPSVSIWLYSRVCVCYYIAAAIAVAAAAATIVATAASHAPHKTRAPTPQTVPSAHAQLEGEKSDPLQSKTQVLRHSVVFFPAGLHIKTFCFTET